MVVIRKGWVGQTNESTTSTGVIIEGEDGSAGRVYFVGMMENIRFEDRKGGWQEDI